MISGSNVSHWSLKSHNPDKFNVMIRLIGIKLFLLLLIIIQAGCGNGTSPGSNVQDGRYWKDQAINDILPYWTENAMDRDSGAFITNLDAKWKHGSDSHKYPSMIGRHIFSYSAAYLMTGNEEYLDIAEQTKDFLLEKAWDSEHGGWYDVLNRDGTPAIRTRNMFIQTYALTGLAMYYFVTHDREVLEYIIESDRLLETALLDTLNDGYYNVAGEDWQIIDSNKSFASQVAPVSGYLLYMYLATGDSVYLQRSRRIMDWVSDRMRDPGSGWILEYFDRNWNMLESDPDIINVGHNIEVAWMLLRLAMLNGTGEMPETARQLEDSLYAATFRKETGLWLTTLGRKDPGITDDFTYWWIQAYGNMYSLCSYRFSGNKERLDHFIKGAEFWDSYFLDRDNGDTFTSVCHNGVAKDSTKANPYKTSYHSIEQCLLNYLYLSFWVNHEPVRLHFRIIHPREGDLLLPVLVEDMDIVVRDARYEGISGNETLTFSERTVTLPEADIARITVTLGNRSVTDN